MCKEASQTILDERIRINLLDEDTKAVYLGEPAKEHPNYDRSVFVEAIFNKTTKEKTLFVPSAKRIDWFRAEYPEAVIVTDSPVFSGKSFSIEARVFLSPEDAQSGRLVARTQYNGYISQDVDLNIACTRAKGRVLRDLGYDLPRDAHEIPGWTKVKEVEGECENADAAESGVSAVVVPVPLVPEKNNVSEVQVASNQTLEKTEVSEKVAPNPPKKTSAAEKSEPASMQEKTASSKKVEVVPVEEEPIEHLEPQEEAISVQNAPNNIASNTKEQSTKSEDVTEPSTVEERAVAMFPNVADAENYQCRVLSGKTVGEQPDARIKYFAQKAIKGERVIDPTLGLACVAVAAKRGLQI